MHLDDCGEYRQRYEVGFWAIDRFETNMEERFWVQVLLDDYLLLQLIHKLKFSPIF